MSVSEAGRKGGNARAKKLSQEKRIEIAKKGYNAGLKQVNLARQLRKSSEIVKPNEENA